MREVKSSDVIAYMVFSNKIYSNNMTKEFFDKRNRLPKCIFFNQINVGEVEDMITKERFSLDYDLAYKNKNGLYILNDALIPITKEEYEKQKSYPISEYIIYMAHEMTVKPFFESNEKNLTLNRSKTKWFN